MYPFSCMESKLTLTLGRPGPSLDRMRGLGHPRRARENVKCTSNISPQSYAHDYHLGRRHQGEIWLLYRLFCGQNRPLFAYGSSLFRVVWRPVRVLFRVLLEQLWGLRGL